MRHNQNGRRFRGRNNNGGGNGGNNGGQSHHHGQRRGGNPRVQIFDSNGPDVRIRGNAIQVTEKYLALAKDASSAGDRVLAESYFQYAEHYQRLLNEAQEESMRNNPQPQQQPQSQQQSSQQPQLQQQPQQQSSQQRHFDSSEQPEIEMDDLDQSFLVGKQRATRKSTGTTGPAGSTESKETETAG